MHPVLLLGAVFGGAALLNTRSRTESLDGFGGADKEAFFNMGQMAFQASGKTPKTVRGTDLWAAMERSGLDEDSWQLEAFKYGFQHAQSPDDPEEQAWIEKQIGMGGYYDNAGPGLQWSFGPQDNYGYYEPTEGARKFLTGSSSTSRKLADLDAEFEEALGALPANLPPSWGVPHPSMRRSGRAPEGWDPKLFDREGSFGASNPLKGWKRKKSILGPVHHQETEKYRYHIVPRPRSGTVRLLVRGKGDGPRGEYRNETYWPTPGKAAGYARAHQKINSVKTYLDLGGRRSSAPPLGKWARGSAHHRAVASGPKDVAYYFYDGREAGSTDLPAESLREWVHRGRALKGWQGEWWNKGFRSGRKALKREGARHVTFGATLSSAQRRALPAKAFGLPGQRKYPINDRGHAIAAKGRALTALRDGFINERQYKQIWNKAERLLKAHGDR